MGDAPVRAEWDAVSWYYSSFSGQCEPSVSRALAGAVCDVIARRVDHVEPARGLIGRSVDVTVTGSGFGTMPPTVNVGGGITVSNVELVSSGEVRARFNIPPTTPGGNHAVSVTTSFGQTSTVLGNFFVQIPASLQVLFAAFSSLPNGCPTSQPYGTRLRLRYQVKDQAGNVIAFAMPIREDLTDLVILGVRNPSFNVINGTPTESGMTEGDGSFVDNPVGLCAEPPPFPAGARATFRQRLFVPIGSIVHDVRLNNFSMTLRSDCGDGTNGSDIDVKNCP